MSKPVRIGILGTGYVVSPALLQPAKEVPGIVIESVGSRSVDRAQRFATANAIPKAQTYEATISDPTIDAIYIALPNSMHVEWTLRALQAGKHVLCEKPMACNNKEAEAIVRMVEDSDRVFMEAFHYPYHPFAKRVRDILDTGALGKIVGAEAFMQIPSKYVPPGGIRHAFELGGGAMMDAGCYTLHGLRDVLGEVEDVLHAQAQRDSQDPQVDVAMDATLEFEGGKTGTLHTSFLGVDNGDFRLLVQGERGTLEIQSLYLPQWGGALRLQCGSRVYTEEADHTPTYIFQLREFLRCVQTGAPVLTSARDGARILRTVDLVYQKAGLKMRGAY